MSSVETKLDMIIEELRSISARLSILEEIVNPIIKSKVKSAKTKKERDSERYFKNKAILKAVKEGKPIPKQSESTTSHSTQTSDGESDNENNNSKVKEEITVIKPVANKAKSMLDRIRASNNTKNFDLKLMLNKLKDDKKPAAEENSTILDDTEEAANTSDVEYSDNESVIPDEPEPELIKPSKHARRLIQSNKNN